MSAPTLRKYQQDQIAAVCDAYEKGLNRILIKSPTGTGKTVTFAAMLQDERLRGILDRWPKKGARMLVIAHREELLDQAAEKIQKANPGIMVSIEQGDRRAHRYSDVIIASIQTLAAMKFRRLLKLLEWHQPRLVIVDEAHHAAAASYRTALVHLGFLPAADLSESTETEAPTYDDVEVMEKALRGWDETAPKDRILVGVTATPNRSDAIGLGCVFQTIAYSYALKQAIEDKYLVPIKPWVIETDTSLDDVRISHGEFNQKDLADAVNNERRNQLALAAWEERALGLSTIAFTVDVAHAHAMAEKFRQAGHRALAISGETPKDDRRQALRNYTEGTIDLLMNCMVLTEGTDLPRTRCILHAKPTKSATLYEQMTGRGLRIHPGKDECIVIDLVDVAQRHSLQAAPVLYGLPPGLKTKGQDLKELSEGLEGLREKFSNVNFDELLESGRYSLEELRAKASTFDIWTVPELAAEIRQAVSMNWITTGPDSYRLQYPWNDGTEILTVQRDILNHFEVVATMRPHQEPGQRVVAMPRQRTLATQIPTALQALSMAEQYVHNERQAVTRLKASDAPWRQRPASPKQLSYLTKLRVPHNPKTITMGEASDLIDLAHSRRPQRGAYGGRR